MHVNILNVISALALSGYAALAEKFEKRETCHFSFSGYNSEGGGGPGQVPLNNYQFDFGIAVGGTSRFSKHLDSNGDFAFAVSKDDYNGNHNMYARANYEFGTISWASCDISFDGGDYINGTVTNDIDSGTVSTIDSACTVTYDC